MTLELRWHVRDFGTRFIARPDQTLTQVATEVLVRLDRTTAGSGPSRGNTGRAEPSSHGMSGLGRDMRVAALAAE